MASDKFFPSAALVTFDSTDYYMIDIQLTEDAEEIDATDGATTGDGREYISGGRVSRQLTGKLFLFQDVAEPVVNASGALTLTAKEGTTDKAWAVTDAVIINKGITINPAGSDPAYATYTFRLNGALTPTQYT